MLAGDSPYHTPDAGVPALAALRAVVECAKADDCTSDQLASLIETLGPFAQRVERVGAVRVLGTDFPANRGLERSIMNLGKERVGLMAMVELASLGGAGTHEIEFVKAKFDTLLADEASRNFMPQVIRSSFSGKSIEFVRESNRAAVAFLYDSKGNRLLSHRFDVDQASLEKMLDQYKIEWTLLLKDQAANKLLAHLPNWKHVYTDDTATIYVRYPDC